LSPFFIKFVSTVNFETKDYYANSNFWWDLKRVLSDPKLSLEQKNLHIKRTKDFIILDPATGLPV
jgi:hypothetical protein